MEHWQRRHQRDRSMREDGRMLLRRLLSAALVALFVSSVSHAEAPSGTGPLLAGQTATALAGNRWLLARSEEHTSELQSHHDLVCRLLLEKKNKLRTTPPS